MPSPFMRAVARTTIMRHVRESEAIGAPATTQTSFAALSDLQEAERFKLAQGRGNSFLVHAVVDKLKLRDDQASVLLSAVVPVLDLNSVEYQTRR